MSKQPASTLDPIFEPSGVVMILDSIQTKYEGKNDADPAAYTAEVRGVFNQLIRHC